jgi:hypothetical protein
MKTSPRKLILVFSTRSRYFSIQVAPQLYSRGWVEPIPNPLFLRKSGSAGNRTQDLWICSPELWPLDHREMNRFSNKAVLFLYAEPYAVLRIANGYTPLLDIVAYLPRAGRAEPQKQPFISNTSMQKWKNGVMQPSSRQRLGKRNSAQAHDVTFQQCLTVTWLIFLYGLRHATELCFLPCPCCGYVTRVHLQLRWVFSWVPRFHIDWTRNCKKPS